MCAHLFPEVHGKLVGLIDFGGTRGDLGLGEIAYRITQGVNVFAKLKVKSGQVAHGFVSAMGLI